MYKFRTDALNLNSVSIEKQKIDEAGNAISLPHRCVYTNSPKGREQLAADAPEPYLSAVLAVWRDEPTIKDPESVPVDPTDPNNPASLVSMQAQRQAHNRDALAAYLAVHPLLWMDGKYYGVTLDDQQEMSLNLMQYQLAVQAGQSAKLEWHSVKSACTEWTLEDYTVLSLAVSEFVYPYLRYQEHIKEQIFAAETLEELEAIVIDYESVAQT